MTKAAIATNGNEVTFSVLQWWALFLKLGQKLKLSYSRGFAVQLSQTLFFSANTSEVRFHVTGLVNALMQKDRIAIIEKLIIVKNATFEIDDHRFFSHSSNLKPQNKL